ncbi:MAG: cupin domain-containing protein [Christensenellales bacterium]
MSTEYNGRKPEYKEYAEPNLTRTLSVPSDSVFEAAFYVDASDKIRPPQRFAPHIHDTIEFYVLLDGESSFSVENKVYKLQAGDAVLSRPNELHYCLHDSNARHSHACLWFVPNDRFLFGDFLRSERNHLVPSDADKDELTRILFGLKKAAEDRDKQSQYAYLVYALTLLRTALGIKKRTRQTRNLFRPFCRRYSTIFRTISAR